MSGGGAGAAGANAGGAHRGRWAMTLRSRLLISVLLVFATLAVAGFSLARAQHRYLVDQLDRRLLEAVPPALGMARLVADGTFAMPPGGPGPGALSELYVGRLGDDGGVRTVLAPGLGVAERAGGSTASAVTVPASASASALTVPASAFPASTARASAPAPPGGAAPARVSAPFDTVDEQGVAMRAVVAVDGGDAGLSGDRFVVGLPLAEADAAHRRLLIGLGVAALVVVTATAVAAWWVIRLGLRPIRRMTEAADAIARGEVGRRVEHPSPRTEAGRLGLAFNVMLDEREGTEARLRRFLSDASHELRTPLTSIRGYVDLYRRGGLGGGRDLDDAMRRIGGESARMAALVEDLLLLARLDEGRPLADEPVELAALVRDTVSDAAAVQPERPVRAVAAGPLLLRGDEARLRQVIAAVVTNALVHTEPTTPVGVEAVNDGAVHVITISDDGPGMAPEVAAHAFERFFRGDPARSRNRGGSGLGLAIVRSIVEAHGGTVTLRSAVGAGTSVRIVLPITRCVAGERAPGQGQRSPTGPFPPDGT